MKFFVVITLLLITTDCFAAGFLEIKTKADNFILSNKIERNIENGIRKIYSDFRNIFNLRYRNAPTVRNHIFATKKQYMNFARKFDIPVSNHNGFYTGQTNIAYTWQQNSQNALMAVMMHESTHRLVAQKFPNCPPWLNEGLAQFYEGLEVDGGKLRITPDDNSDMVIRRSFINNALPDLSDFVNSGRNEFYRLNIGYEMGWSIVYFMMSSATGKQVLEAIYENSSKRESRQETITEVIDYNYPRGFKIFKQDWEDWLQKQRTELNVALYY